MPNVWNDPFDDRGYCLIAYGKQAEQAAATCAASIKNHCPHPISLPNIQPPQGKEGEQLSPAQMARWAKVNLYEWSPYEYTCYLDADTEVCGSLDAGFSAIESGWDIALCPSTHQDDDLLWHVGTREREETISSLGHVLQLQCGVLWFRRSEAVRRLFLEWREQWLEYRGEDQGAFLRALARCPVRIWLMGFPFNGGAVVRHNWGMLRRQS